MVQLKWKTALVTGGSRGIGRGIVLKLAENGVKRIAINYLENDIAANETLKTLKDHGSDGFLVRADVGKADDIRKMFETVKSNFGSLEVFVHNARPSPAAFYQGPMQITEAAWRAAFDTQALAMTLACQQCVPLMPNGGRMIAITYAPGGRT